MRNLKQLLFGAPGRAELAEDVRAALEAWRRLPAPDLDQYHFHTRYVLVDVATAGLESERGALLGLAGLGLGQGGLIVPEDALALDFAAPEASDAASLDRRLLAFLNFAGKGPLVTYQVPFVGAFLERLLAERLDLQFQPVWIDLAWLLPDLFKEKIDGLVPLDTWLAAFGIEVPGRHDALADCLALARLLQLALPRAVERGADTPRKLADISRARRWLRPSG